MNRTPFVVSGIVLAIGPAATAQAPGAATPRPTAAATTAVVDDRAADRAELATLVATFVRAFEAGDARALAATFTEDATVADDSGTTRGREAIEARFAAYLADNPKARIQVQPESLRLITPDVAVEDGRAVITPAAGSGRRASSKYTVVYVRRDGRWLHSSLRDFDDVEPPPSDRLRDIEWLVGDWVNESQDAVVLSTVKWSDDRNYLLRDFTVQVAGRPAIKGTQRIGWDPSLKQIRSWVFDSEGGFNEGYWSRSGDRWMIKSHGVHHDGKAVSATQTITRLGRDALRWASSDRTRGDDHLPSGDEFTMVRRPPQPLTGTPGSPRGR